MEVRFTVNGAPAPQGSKVKTRWGVREDNPRTKPWRAEVAGEALDVMEGIELLTGPLEVHALFYFQRPKGHYGTGKNAEVLKANAANFHTSKPDADKLQRAIGDAITGIVMRDDSQVVHWSVWKLYGRPRAEIVVRQAPTTFLPHTVTGPFAASRPEQ